MHLPVNFPPAIVIFWLVNSLKGVSSRRPGQGFKDLRGHYRQAKRLWSTSYLAGPAGGAPVSVLHQHIQQQDRPV
jgi:putative transposase